MIKGIGIDIFEIDRLVKKIDTRLFLEQIMNYNQRANINQNILVNDAASYFTIKEAILKALGCGLQKGYFWKDIEITSNVDFSLKGRLKKIADQKSITRMHCSTTQTKQLSFSFVIMETD